MSTLLHLRSSANLESAASRAVGDQLVKRLAADRVVTRDLALNPPPHIGPEFVAVVNAGTPEHPALALSNQLVDELLAADVVVIEAPMYNFAIPSTLKAWFDQVTRSGRTFSYATGRPEGLVKGKRVYLVLGAGGVYDNSPVDFQEPYLRHMLAFMGMTDVQVVRVHGTIGDRDGAVARAVERLSA